ncbi:hypothetical protein Dimus_024826, partial [Dionaea muscipula]
HRLRRHVTKGKVVVEEPWDQLLLSLMMIGMIVVMEHLGHGSAHEQAHQEQEEEREEEEVMKEAHNEVMVETDPKDDTHEEVSKGTDLNGNKINDVDVDPKDDAQVEASRATDFDKDLDALIGDTVDDAAKNP